MIDKAQYDLRDIIPDQGARHDYGDYHSDLCPFHKETNPSLLIWPDHYVCKACQAQGDIISWLRAQGLGYNQAIQKLEAGDIPKSPVKPKPIEKPKPLDISLAERYHLAITPDVADYYRRRGLSDRSIIEYRLGYGSPPGDTVSRFSIPVIIDNELMNIRFRRDDRCPNCKIDGILENNTLTCIICGLEWNISSPDKYKGIWGHNNTWLFNSTNLVKSARDQKMLDRVFLVGGEFDAIVASDKGFYSVAATSGEGAFKKEWLEYFLATNEVYIVTDNDSAGIEAAHKLNRLIPKATILHLEDVGHKGDITDYFVSHSPEQFEDMIERTKQHKAKTRWTEYLKRIMYKRNSRNFQNSSKLTQKTAVESTPM